MCAQGWKRIARCLLVAAVLPLSVMSVPTVASAATTTVEVTGHGYGHGRGMGQWGAYGYATTQGWGYEQIVAHYYGGTVLGAVGNSITTVQLTAQDNKDLVVTSGSDFVVGGVRVSGGSAARVQARTDGSFVLSTSYGCSSPAVWTTGVPNSRVQSAVGDPGNNLNQMLSLCGPSGTTQYRGELSVVSVNGAQRTINTVYMEDYLRGVVPRESPASWGDAAEGRGLEALKAQAVAARSYAYAESRSTVAKTCDTTSCQVYSGAGTNGASTEDRRTDAAVSGTWGRVVQNAQGTILRAEFSSSTGGYTAGGLFPAVADAGDASSPYHDWSVSLSASSVAGAFGVGELVEVRVLSRNGLGADGGRVTQVQVVGTQRSVTVTGNDFRSKTGLRSDWFSVTPARVDLPAVFQAGSAGSALAASFGNTGDQVLTCDWNGDGIATPGVFRSGWFYLANSTVAPRADLSFGFGNPGDVAVCGDWDGDGRETVGLYRQGVVYLKNSNEAGPTDGSLYFGAPGDRPVVGDWDADGYDTMGVWREGRFFLTNSNLRPTTAAVLSYGSVGDQPVVGDWNGDGSTTLGVYRDGVFLLRDSNTSGRADRSVPFGNTGDTPLSGPWSGTGADQVGVARGY